MFDFIAVSIMIVFSGIVVFRHIKKQLKQGNSREKCTDCPLYKEPR
jgi:hypothetical protein